MLGPNWLFAVQWGEDADVKIRDLGMGELGTDDFA